MAPFGKKFRPRLLTSAGRKRPRNTKMSVNPEGGALTVAPIGVPIGEALADFESLQKKTDMLDSITEKEFNMKFRNVRNRIEGRETSRT